MADDGVRLIYHPVPGDGSSEAFADALGVVVKGSSAVDVACPYLSHDILAALADGRRFRLVTDQHELVAQGLDVSLRDLLREQHERIRSVRGLHAKVVLGQAAGLFGSANMTTTGLTMRFEMAAVVRGRHLDELRRWFANLWTVGQPLDQSVLDEGVRVAERARAAGEQRPRGPALTKTGSLGWLATKSTSGSSTGSGRRQRAGTSSPSTPSDRTTATSAPAAGVSDADIAELAQQLRERTSSREPAQRVLELLAEALEVINLPVHDPGLHLNFGSRPASITLGQRYVASLGSVVGEESFALLLDDFDVAARYANDPGALGAGSFTQGGEDDVPRIFWRPDHVLTIPDEVLESWRRALASERERARKSSYLRFKRESLYHILEDEHLRLKVLDLAHPERGA